MSVIFHGYLPTDVWIPCPTEYSPVNNSVDVFGASLIVIDFGTIKRKMMYYFTGNGNKWITYLPSFPLDVQVINKISLTIPLVDSFGVRTVNSAIKMMYFSNLIYVKVAINYKRKPTSNI